MRAAFVISALMTGGAEMMLYKLLKTLPRERVEPLVISLGRGGRPAELIERLKVSVIGLELDDFQRDPAQRARLRAELGATEGTCVIGHLARYHPMKDQVGLIGAARRVVAEEQEVLLVMAGAGLDGMNTALAAAIRGCRLEQYVRRVGETTCPQALLFACGLFCLPPAWGEGFPNSVGEAMACELPCVVTRVGDGPDLVGPTGLVVDPGDREGLARALLQLVRLGHTGRARLGARARSRIAESFSLPDVATRYAGVFDEAVAMTT